MYFHLIACRVFEQELTRRIQTCPHTVDCTWLPQGLHDTPAILHARLCEILATVEKTNPHPDAILLGYGLCSNGTAELTAGEIPLVLPRADDCVGIMLGGRNRHRACLERYQPVYWLFPGWVETAFLPTPEGFAVRRKEYLEKYGAENAAYLAEQDVAWTKSYRHCGLILPPDGAHEACHALAKRFCALYDWKIAQETADDRLLNGLLAGEWNETDFLICPPRQTVHASFDDNIFHTTP